MTHAVFMGSPEFALPSLKALAAYPGVSLAGVVTQPDRPVGRNRVPQPSPVKQLALEMGLPVLTPASAREPELIESLRGWGVELAVVCAYGQILPESLLSLPRLGCFNLHFSLLPRWRGASPVQAAILAGDTRTGVSLQYMVKQLDAGDIVKDTGPLEISPSETAGSLLERLAGESGTLLEKAMPDLLSGHPPRTPQDPGQVTFCRI
ncbi:MAG: methionyl-tRNA formyltransferase, partial [Deltaproteobacteria bacterium]|nr:methionyl-tRNA formyltransferase [Deltaproteobacteria bacterium]